MKHFLITGATGFIGQSYVEALKREDVKITLLSRPKSVKKTKKLFPDIDVISVDLEQGISEGLEIQFLETVTDIVHVAGGYDIEMSFEEAYISNILVSQNLCQLIKKIKCDYFIDDLDLILDALPKNMKKQIPENLHFFLNF